MTSAFMSDSALEIQLGLSIKDIEPHAWNSLVCGQSPFVQHGFLLALEQSGSVSAKTGWEPCHIAVYQQGCLVAAMPLYIKHHSYGEYVFDWAWADAYRRNGLAYYPKLLTAIPFTPSQSPRLLTQDRTLPIRLAAPIFEAVKAYGEKIGASSWHVLFPDHGTAEVLDTTDLIRREACQFHWNNKNFRSFDDFLATCNSRKRKNLKKERSDVAQQGFRFERLIGAQITAEIWDQFYVFYQNTYQVRGQYGYLTREFFTALHASMPAQVFLIMVSHQDRSGYVAGAMFLKDDTTLYGRYWGCEQDYQNLHFETCYYQGIDICIAEKLQRFDAGAQGEHKLRRGFEPVITCSYHWISHPQFSKAIRDYCEEERSHTEAYKQAAREQLPFKADNSGNQGLSIIKEDN
ncbi:MAG: GNAT family N-acetyltransferase [Pseudohongiella sp.]|nr:GNAT family N-acetyltransferase [Pseudohongiella sp.]